MEIIQQLSILAFYQVLGDRAESILGFVEDRFGDGAQRLHKAMRSANQHAWKALEIALAGNTWWNSCQNLIAARDEQVFRQQVKSFLEACPLPEPSKGGKNFRQECLKELRAARRAQLIPGENLAMDTLAEHTRTLAKYTDPQLLMQTEMQAIHGMGQTLHVAGYTNLAQCVALQPDEGKPLLVVAVRFFFRRLVESDPKLSAGLTFQQLEGISAAQEASFSDLHSALEQHGQKLESLLDNLQTVVEDTHEDVRAMREEMERLTRMLKEREQPASGESDVDQLRAQLEAQSQQLQELFAVVAQAMQQRQGPAPASPQVHPPGPSPSAPAPAVPSPPVAAPPLPSPVPSTPPLVAAPPPASAPVASQAASEDIAEDSDPTGDGVGWDHVRKLLGQARSMSREEQSEAPELFQAVGQLQRVAEQYQATKQTIINLAHAKGTELILDALSANQPNGGKVVVGEPGPSHNAPGGWSRLDQHDVDT